MPGRSSLLLSVSVESWPLWLGEPSFSLHADLELESSSRFSAALSLADMPAPVWPSEAPDLWRGNIELRPTSEEEAGEVCTRGRRDSASR